MTRRPVSRLSVLLAGAVLALTSGCQLGEDDEMAPPTRTITASPSPDTTVAPMTLPVGEGAVSPTDVVWAQGNDLYVGTRNVDLSPVGIEAFVVVPGGVFLVNSGELWFTDLSRLRGTGLTDVTALGVTADATRVLVTVGPPETAATYAYDTASGRAVDSEGLTPVSPGERLHGPDISGVRLPQGFELAGWTGPRTFYGTVGVGARPSEVVSCEVGTGRCTSLGSIDGTEPVVFGTGIE